MKKLFIHCNGNSASGLGHFSRCLALATILKKSYLKTDVVFIGNYRRHAINKFDTSGISYVQVSEKDSFTEKIFLKLSCEKESLLFIDTYLAPQEFFECISLKGVRWAAFDDYASQDFSLAQFVINFRVGAESSFIYGAKNSSLGPQFMPVRAEFFPVRKENEMRKVSSGIEHITICLGGNDALQVTGSLLETVISVFNEAFVHILLSDKKEVARLLSKYKAHAKIKVEKPRVDIENIFLGTDLLISGGGMLKYEAGYCGIPNATLSQTDAQYEDTLILQEQGVTIDLGMAYKFDSLQVEQRLLAFSKHKRQKMRNAQLKIFPPDSHDKLIQLFSNFL